MRDRPADTSNVGAGIERVPIQIAAYYTNIACWELSGTKSGK